MRADTLNFWSLLLFKKWVLVSKSGQFILLKNEKIVCGQKKWAFGHFWPVKVGRKIGEKRLKRAENI